MEDNRKFKVSVKTADGQEHIKHFSPQEFSDNNIGQWLDDNYAGQYSIESSSPMSANDAIDSASTYRVTMTDKENGWSDFRDMDGRTLLDKQERLRANNPTAEISVQKVRSYNNWQDLFNQQDDVDPDRARLNELNQSMASISQDENMSRKEKKNALAALLNERMQNKAYLQDIEDLKKDDEALQTAENALASENPTAYKALRDRFTMVAPGTGGKANKLFGFDINAGEVAGAAVRGIADMFNPVGAVMDIASNIKNSDKDFNDRYSKIATARKYLQEAAELAEAPSHYGDENALKNMWKGLHGGASDIMTPSKLIELGLDMNTVEVIRKIQDNNNGNSTDIASAVKGDTPYLTGEEKSLINAFLRLSDMQAARSTDMSWGYNAGQSTAQSLGFMADFAMMGGVGEAAATKLVGKAIEKGTTNAVKRIGTNMIRNIVKTAAMTPAMTSSYTNLMDGLTTLNDDGQVDLSAKKIGNAVLDVLIENYTENAGDNIEDVVGSLFGGVTGKAGKKALDLAKTKLGDFGSFMYRMANSPVTEKLKDAGFHGFLGEMSEEVYGAALRSITNVDPEAWSDFWSRENLATTAASFGPMTMFGLGGSVVGYKVSENYFNRYADKVLGYYQGEELENAKNAVNALLDAQTPEEIGEIVKNNFGQSPEIAKDAIELARWASAYQTASGYDNEQMKEKAGSIKADLDEALNVTGENGTVHNWYIGEGDNAQVRFITDKDGNEYPAIEPENEDAQYVQVLDNGKLRMLSTEEIVNDVTVPLSQYLGNLAGVQDQYEDEERMAEEAQQRIDYVRSQAVLGSTIEMGTDTESNTGTIRQIMPGDVYVVETAEGVKQMGIEELAKYFGVDPNVRTRQEQIDAEAADYMRKLDIKDAINSADDNFRFTHNGEEYIFVRAMGMPYDENGEEVIKVMVAGDLGENEEIVVPVSSLLSQKAVADAYNETDEIDETPVAEIDETTTDVLADKHGNPLPMRTKKNGEQVVDEKTLYNNDVESYADYSDKVYGEEVTRAFLGDKQKALAKEVADLNKAIAKEKAGKWDDDLIDDYTDKLNSANARLREVSRVLDNYAAADAIAAEQEKARKEAEKKAAERKEAELNEPQSLRQVVANWFKQDLRGKLNRDSFKKETDKSNEEMAKFFMWFAKKGQGMTIDAIAESIMADDTTGLLPMAGEVDQYDAQAIKNEVIEVLRTASVPSDITGMTYAENAEYQRKLEEYYAEYGEGQEEGGEPQEPAEEPIRSFTTRSGRKVNIVIRTKEKDGIKTTKAVGISDGNEVSVGSAATFPIPDGYKVTDSTMPEGAKILGASEIREGNGKVAATVYAEFEDGVAEKIDVALEKVDGTPVAEKPNTEREATISQADIADLYDNRGEYPKSAHKKELLELTMYADTRIYADSKGAAEQELINTAEQYKGEPFADAILSRVKYAEAEKKPAPVAEEPKAITEDDIKVGAAFGLPDGSEGIIIYKSFSDGTFQFFRYGNGEAQNYGSNYPGAIVGREITSGYVPISAGNEAYDKLMEFAKEYHKDETKPARTRRPARNANKSASDAKKVEVKANTLVTEERHEELVRRLKAKLGQLNSGYDPEMFALGAELAMYHIEKGARTFSAYAKAVIAEVGENARQYLKSWYNGARDLPGMEEYAKEMDSYEVVSAIDVNAISAEEEVAEEEVINNDVDNSPVTEKETKKPAKKNKKKQALVENEDELFDEGNEDEIVEDFFSTPGTDVKYEGNDNFLRVSQGEDGKYYAVGRVYADNGNWSGIGKAFTFNTEKEAIEEALNYFRWYADNKAVGRTKIDEFVSKVESEYGITTPEIVEEDKVIEEGLFGNTEVEGGENTFKDTISNEDIEKVEITDKELDDFLFGEGFNTEYTNGDWTITILNSGAINETAILGFHKKGSKKSWDYERHSTPEFAVKYLKAYGFKKGGKFEDSDDYLFPVTMDDATENDEFVNDNGDVLIVTNGDGGEVSFDYYYGHAPNFKHSRTYSLERFTKYLNKMGYRIAGEEDADTVAGARKKSKVKKDSAGRGLFAQPQNVETEEFIDEVEDEVVEEFDEEETPKPTKPKGGKGKNGAEKTSKPKAAKKIDVSKDPLVLDIKKKMEDIAKEHTEYNIRPVGEFRKVVDNLLKAVAPTWERGNDDKKAAARLDYIVKDLPDNMIIFLARAWQRHGDYETDKEMYTHGASSRYMDLWPQQAGERELERRGITAEQVSKRLNEFVASLDGKRPDYWDVDEMETILRPLKSEDAHDVLKQLPTDVLDEYSSHRTRFDDEADGIIKEPYEEKVFKANVKALKAFGNKFEGDIPATEENRNDLLEILDKDILPIQRDSLKTRNRFGIFNNYQIPKEELESLGHYVWRGGQFIISVLRKAPDNVIKFLMNDINIVRDVIEYATMVAKERGMEVPERVAAPDIEIYETPTATHSEEGDFARYTSGAREPYMAIFHRAGKWGADIDSKPYVTWIDKDTKSEAIKDAIKKLEKKVADNSAYYTKNGRSDDMRLLNKLKYQTLPAALREEGFYDSKPGAMAPIEFGEETSLFGGDVKKTEDAKAKRKDTIKKAVKTGNAAKVVKAVEDNLDIVPDLFNAELGEIVEEFHERPITEQSKENLVKAVEKVVADETEEEKPAETPTLTKQEHDELVNKAVKAIKAYGEDIVKQINGGVDFVAPALSLSKAYDEAARELRSKTFGTEYENIDWDAIYKKAGFAPADLDTLTDEYNRRKQAEKEENDRVVNTVFHPKFNVGDTVTYKGHQMKVEDVIPGNPNKYHLVDETIPYLPVNFMGVSETDIKGEGENEKSVRDVLSENIGVNFNDVATGEPYTIAIVNGETVYIAHNGNLEKMSADEVANNILNKTWVTFSEYNELNVSKEETPSTERNWQKIYAVEMGEDAYKVAKENARKVNPKVDYRGKYLVDDLMHDAWYEPQVMPDYEDTRDWHYAVEELTKMGIDWQTGNEIEKEPIVSDLGSTYGEVKKSKHTKTGEDIWVVNRTSGSRLSKEEFDAVRKRAKLFGGYYSSFKSNKGFIFKSEEDANNFNNLNNNENVNIERTDAKTASDTAAIVREAGSLGQEAEVILNGGEGNAEEVVKKIDETIEDIDAQLALLGDYYDGESARTLPKLAAKLSADTGLEFRAADKGYNIVSAYYGNPTHSGNRRDVEVFFNTNYQGGRFADITTGLGLSRELSVRTANPTYAKILSYIRKFLPGMVKGENAMTSGNLLDTAKNIAETNRKNGENSVSSREGDKLIDTLFEGETPAPQREELTEYNGYKKGEMVLFSHPGRKADKVKLLDFEVMGTSVRPIVDSFHSIVMSEVTEWEYITKLDGTTPTSPDKGTPKKELSAFEKAARIAFSGKVASEMINAVDTGERPIKSINDLRKLARDAKMEVDAEGRDDILLQELAEVGIVRAARYIVDSGRYGENGSKECFDAIVRLYESQPTIAQRSSNRIAMGQYSTPVPMGFLADMFADGGKASSVFEPTAGNGMLVYGIPANIVHVNELDDVRHDNLLSQGFASVTNEDATSDSIRERGRIYDAIIANPPFGSAEAKEYDGKVISGLDPQIALNALETMKDDGKAAIILGGNLDYAPNGSIRTKKQFVTYLYDHYNVKGIVNMGGDLFQRQGTTFETMMILIDGRRSEEERAQTKVYPPVKAKAARKAETFDDLFDIINEIKNSNNKTDGTEILRSSHGESVSDTLGQTGRGDRGTDNTESSQNASSSVRGGQRGSTNVERVEDNGDKGVLGESRPNAPARTQLGEAETNLNGEKGGNRVNDAQSVDAVGVSTAGVGLETQDKKKPREIKRREDEKRELGQEKLHYRPHNEAFSLESVAPAAMVESMDSFLKKIEDEEGDITDFVRRELGYNTDEELYNALAAEQVDSVAMAIYHMKHGEAMIIGDQTGVGKGRQMASLVRWAVNQGKKPIFITQKADLFSDLYRDLVDVGSGNLRPFIFNSDGAMVDANGKKVYSPVSPASMKKILESGQLPSGYDFAILTYSQVNTGDAISMAENSANVKAAGGGRFGTKKSKASKEGKPTPKATFLRAIAKDNYMFLDESHTAAGESNTGIYLQSLVKDAAGVTFASATFAKRPDTMPLYAIRTAMSKANVKTSELIEVIKKGGVTLQEIMSRALTEAGQMVRRERDMSDVVTDWETITDPETVRKARENYDKTIEAFNDIIKFQEAYIKPRIEETNEVLAQVASTANVKKGTDKMGLSNVPFASKTYNYTKQLMLALKADAIADKVEELIMKGLHPVIALESTMEASIKDYAVGEEIAEPTFSSALLKGLESVMQYTEKDEDGNETHHTYSLEELGEEATDAYYKLQDKIRENTAGIFISPLDAIIEKITEKGYSVGELTGRNLYVENVDGKTIVRKRTDKDKKRMQREFNSGELDVLILNKSASTGISLHASSKFSDQRQRAMIIAQPLSDINDYMQMIGRIDRTGQVHRGYYVNLGLPVPAESRFLMMLSTKLKSLNANTTTAQESESNSVDAPDLLNKYGSQVVVEYLRDNFDIYEKIGKPLKNVNTSSELDKYNAGEDDARKVTGYVALLSTEEQENFYSDVTERYNNLIKYLDETGENDLKITVMPLRAKTIDKAVSSPGLEPDGANPFARDAYVEKVQMDVLRKPMKAKDVAATIEQFTEGKDPKVYIKEFEEKIAGEQKARLEAEDERYRNAKVKLEDFLARRRDAIYGNEKLTDAEKREAYNKIEKSNREKVENTHSERVTSLNNYYKKFRMYVKLFTPGKTYLMENGAGVFEGEVGYTPVIFCGLKAKKEKLNPSSTFAVFAILDARRKMEIPVTHISELEAIRHLTEMNYGVASRTTLDNWDENVPNDARKEGYILTGNIIQAISSIEEVVNEETGASYRPGQLISFTDIDGNIRDGVLMPDAWDPKFLKKTGVPVNARLDDLKAGDTLYGVTHDITVQNYGNVGYRLWVPKEKKTGGQFFLNDRILGLVEGGVFTQFKGKFIATIREENIKELLDILANEGVRVYGRGEEPSVDLMVSSSEYTSDNEAVNAVSMLLDEAGVDYRVVSNEEMEALRNDSAATLEDSDFEIRTKPAPKKTGIGYKVFYRGKDGKLYPPMVANKGGVDTPVGVWLDAEEGTRAADSKTGRPQVKQGGKGTQGGSGTLAYRPGWHLGEIPYALQFNRKDENGEKTLFPKDFVWAEVEYAMDVDYQDEAMAEGTNANGKFQHSLAGLKRLPEDGYYKYRTNPNPATDPWIITGAMKVNKILTKDEVDELVRKAGREPQRVELMADTKGKVYGAAKDGVIYLNEDVLNANTPIHEYTHLWDKAVQKSNPRLWNRGVELMKQTSTWDEVVNDPNYASLAGDKDRIASEVHSRLSGTDGARLLNEMAEGEKASGIVAKLRKWVGDFWKYVKDTFTPWSKEDADAVSVEDFIRMPLADLARGKNPNAFVRAKGENEPNYDYNKYLLDEYARKANIPCAAYVMAMPDKEAVRLLTGIEDETILQYVTGRLGDLFRGTGTAAYYPSLDKIVIFGSKSKNETAFDVDMYHESVHALVKRSNGKLADTVGKALLDVAKNSELPIFKAIMNNLERAYKPDSWNEEILTFAVSKFVVEENDVETLRSLVDEENRKLLDEIINTIGYDRNRAQGYSSGEVPGSGMENVREEVSPKARNPYTGRLYGGVYGRRNQNGRGRKEGKTELQVVTPSEDADYLDAVDRGDMETAQRMVVAAAKKAMPDTKVVDEDGNPLVVYHGTREMFNVFDPERRPVNGRTFGDGFYFSSSRELAERFASKYVDSQKVVVPAFLNIEDIVDIDAKGKSDWRAEERRQQIALWNEKRKTPDGVVLRNINDGYSIEADTYMVRDNRNIKSAEPVTYDDNGNVIPLSQRFNRETSDIRFREAYHGSRADFDVFDQAFMGTGEGANVHGYGTYVTFEESTGRKYANVLADGGHKLRYDGLFNISTSAEERAIGTILNMVDAGNSVKDAIDYVREDMGSVNESLAPLFANIDESDFVENEIKRNFYTVDIPDDNGDNYLAEGNTVKKSSRKRIADVVRGMDESELQKDTHGSNWMPNGLESVANGIENNQLDASGIRARLVDAFGSEKRASEIMSEAGFVGILYRGGIDKDCAVIFNAEDIDIQGHEKYRPADENLRSADPLSYSQSTSAKRHSVEETARKAGVKVNIVSRNDMPNGHKFAKGYWKDGKVYVCLENHNDEEDAAKTVLHEGVGHNGLRKLVGEDNFRQFLRDIRKRLPDAVQREIAQDAIRRGGRFDIATEEYLARFAEGMDIDREVRRNVFDKLRSALRDLLAKVGINVRLTDRDIMWLMWQSRHANDEKGILSEAKRQTIANRLGFSLHAQEVGAIVRDNMRMRENAVAYSAARLYNKDVANMWSRLHETWVDKDDAVLSLKQALEKTSGREAKPFEDVALALNQQSSRGLAAIEKWERKYWEPLAESVKEICDALEISVAELERYMMVKHGLERNDKLAQRDAKARYQAIYDAYVKKVNDQDNLEDEEKEKLIAKADKALERHFKKIEAGEDGVYLSFRESDYSGLISIYSRYEGNTNKDPDETEEEYNARMKAMRHPIYENLAQTEEAAYKDVAEFEGKAGEDRIDQLWERVNAATKATLEIQYKGNVISRETYNNVSGMFDYYVPLRGFKDKTAEDMYSYYTDNYSNSFVPTLMMAKGRKSEAGSPLGYIGAQASSAVAQSEKNNTKLALYYFVSNRADNDLVTISDVWYEKQTDPDTGDVSFVAVYPPLSEDLTSEGAKRAYIAWEEGMKEKAKRGEAFRRENKLKLGRIVSHIDEGNKDSHIIKFKVGGKDKMIYINGNPRAAESINNQLSIETSTDYQRFFGKLLRFFSGINTSYNPEFWISNLQRDLLFSMMSTSIKEDKEYNKRFHENLRVNLGSWFTGKKKSLRQLMKDYEDETLGNTQTEQYYKEFVDNGGVTGYTSLRDNEEWGAMIRKSAGEEKVAIEKIRGMFDKVAEFGEAFEQMTRFTAYVTSRQMGKEVREAVADAKELTVNFNRKGSGKVISLEEAKKLRNNKNEPLSPVEQALVCGLSMIPAYGRRAIMFFNAGVQGLNAVWQLAKKDKKSLAVWAGMYMAAGALNAILHSLLDDDDDYLDIPDYERRNNALLGANGVFFKWALPQEARGFYAFGDMMVNKSLGREPHKSVAGEVFNMLADVSPINPTEGITAFAPSALSPIIEVTMNKDYKGSQIHPDNKYRSKEEKKNSPKYKETFNGTAWYYVSLAQLLNSIGGDEYDRGLINIYPDSVEHLVEGYTGGAGTTVEKFVDGTLSALGFAIDSATGLDTQKRLGTFSVRRTPFLSRLVTVNDERYRNQHVNDLYWYYRNEANHTDEVYKKAIANGDMDKIDELMESGRIDRMTIFEAWDGTIKGYSDLLKLTDDQRERKELMAEQDELKKEMIYEISNLK